jgi:hypothetical protein
LVRGRILIRCKEATADFLADLAVHDAALDALESDLAGLEARIRNIETGDFLVDHLQLLLDAKLEESEFDTRLAAWDVSLDAIEDAAVEVSNRQRNVDRQLRILRRQRRVAP